MTATDQPAQRYRLGLTGPLFEIAMPRRDFRGLTERELDRLAGDLRKVEDRLRGYDDQAAPLLAGIAALKDGPWWARVRAALIARGEPAEDLDANYSSCYGIRDSLRADEQGLIDDALRSVDPAPLAAQLAELIAIASTIKTGKLVAALTVLMIFHPFGTPHQIQINIGAAFGMKPVDVTEDGHVVLGYGEEGPPQEMPWETGKLTAASIIGEAPSKDPEEPGWIEPYEGLLSWMGETAEILQDRTGALLQIRQDVVEHLHFEVEHLAERDTAPAALKTIAGQLFMLNRLLLGLCEEVNEPRRKLIDNLGKVLASFEGRWREPKPKGIMLEHYLRIGFDKVMLP
jgi:hypothetical protein